MKKGPKPSNVSDNCLSASCERLPAFPAKSLPPAHRNRGSGGFVSLAHSRYERSPTLDDAILQALPSSVRLGLTPFRPLLGLRHYLENLGKLFENPDAIPAPLPVMRFHVAIPGMTCHSRPFSIRVSGKRKQRWPQHQTSLRAARVMMQRAVMASAKSSIFASPSAGTASPA